VADGNRPVVGVFTAFYFVVRIHHDGPIGKLYDLVLCQAFVRYRLRSSECGQLACFPLVGADASGVPKPRGISKKCQKTSKTGVLERGTNGGDENWTDR
jgi:hypothetical protein